MQRVPAYPLVYEFTRHLEPRVRIQPGERLLVESEDALSGQLRKPGDKRDKTKQPYSNPVAGPIWVEGAEPGDVLAVDIHSITPTIGQCSTYSGPAKALAEWLGQEGPHNAHVMPIKDGVIHWSDTLTIPYTPMLGCIGTAPDWGVPTTAPCGPHGGNMDILETAPGSTVYLPVFIKGGYLYLGDAHAAQGHGELSIVGLEMPAETEITVRLIKQKKLTSPRIESAHELIAISTGMSMERCFAHATSLLILWLEEEYGWNRWRAFDLITHTGMMTLGYYGIGTVGMKIAKTYALNPC